MRRHRFLTILLCVALIISVVPIKSEAYLRDKHDEIMTQVLFTKYGNIRNDSSVQKYIHALASACYLTIDQYNGSGQKALAELISFGVKGIPSQISEINYTAQVSRHRDFTHRGWKADYGGEMKTKWPLRQDILRNTVNKVFDFAENDKQMDAFCELLYYVHILGDHVADKSFNDFNGNNGRKIPVGGEHDKDDIIHKLLDLMPILFAEQTNTHKYRHVISKLHSMNNNFDKLVNSVGGINNDEKFEQHKTLVNNLIDILSFNLPEMLKEETFFGEVFYAEEQITDIIDWIDDLIKNAV